MANVSTSYTDTGSTTDGLRQWLFVLFAILFPLSNWIPSLTGTGRTIGEQSDASDTLLVPWPPAFSIWFIIFVGMAAFAVIQALPSNRDRPAFRATGWWFIAAMALSVCWSLAASYAPIESSRWLTAVIFVPYAIVVTEGMVRLTEWRGALFGHERWLCWAPASLYAGWCSLAVFLNWEQVFVVGPLVLPFSEVIVSVALLIAAVSWISFNLIRSDGNWFYALSPIWGLAFLAYARLVVDDISWIVGFAALIGIVAVFLLTLKARRNA